MGLSVDHRSLSVQWQGYHPFYVLGQGDCLGAYTHAHAWHMLSVLEELAREFIKPNELPMITIVMIMIAHAHTHMHGLVRLWLNNFYVKL